MECRWSVLRDALLSRVHRQLRGPWPPSWRKGPKWTYAHPSGQLTQQMCVWLIWGSEAKKRTRYEPEGERMTVMEGPKSQTLLTFWATSASIRLMTFKLSVKALVSNALNRQICTDHRGGPRKIKISRLQATRWACRAKLFMHIVFLLESCEPQIILNTCTTCRRWDAGTS